MGLRAYFDKELNTAIVFTILGIFAGYTSFLINRSDMAFVLMVVVAVVFYFIAKTAAKIKEDKKWWLSNAFIIYIFVWFISWTIYYNLGLR